MKYTPDGNEASRKTMVGARSPWKCDSECPLWAALITVSNFCAAWCCPLESPATDAFLARNITPGLGFRIAALLKGCTHAICLIVTVFKQ